MAQKFASDYNDVAARLKEFRAKYPEGSLQPARPEKPFEVVELNGQTYLVYGAAAYRTPDDPRPGIGYAYEIVPGKTPYTRGSELQNAETSAWGRAIVAALVADTKLGVASAEEVRNREAEREAAPVRTDMPWFKATMNRVATAGPDLLDRLESNASSKYHAGQLADPEAKQLRSAINDRRKALAAEEASASRVEAATGDGSAAA